MNSDDQESSRNLSRPTSPNMRRKMSAKPNHGLDAILAASISSGIPLRDTTGWHWHYLSVFVSAIISKILECFLCWGERLKGRAQIKSGPSSEHQRYEAVADTLLSWHTYLSDDAVHGRARNRKDGNTNTEKAMSVLRLLRALRMIEAEIARSHLSNWMDSISQETQSSNQPSQEYENAVSLGEMWVSQLKKCLETGGWEKFEEILPVQAPTTVSNPPSPKPDSVRPTIESGSTQPSDHRQPTSSLHNLSIEAPATRPMAMIAKPGLGIIDEGVNDTSSCNTATTGHLKHRICFSGSLQCAVIGADNDKRYFTVILDTANYAKSYISEEVVDQLGFKFKMKPVPDTSEKVQDANGNEFTPIGSIKLDFWFYSVQVLKTFQEHFWVVRPNNVQMNLGKKWIESRWDEVDRIPVTPLLPGAKKMKVSETLAAQENAEREDAERRRREQEARREETERRLREQQEITNEAKE